LTVLAVVSLAAALAGMIWWATAVHGSWATVAILGIGIPVGLLIGALPLAIAQALRALADIGEDMAFEALTTAASSPY
jgi:hypothetical protein